MITDLSDHRNVSAVVTQAEGENSLVWSFDHRDVDDRISQHQSRRFKTTPVTRTEWDIFDLDAVAGRQSDVAASHLENVRDDSGGRGSAAGSGDRDDGDSAGCARWEKQLNNRTRHIARFPYHWFRVQTQAGACVDLAEAAASFSK